MDLNKELLDYEIGGIGDIKKYTLRFHSYYVIARDGEVTIYAEYEPGNPPKVFNGYPSGQELLLELCNLYLEVKDKVTEEAACVIIRWCTENLHPYYFYNEERDLIEEYSSDEEMWDMLVNVLSGYPVYIDKMLPDLKRLYTDTMTVFALRHLIDGNFLEAQRVYDSVDVPEEENLIRRWFGSGKLGQQKLCAEIISNLPKLSMELVFDDKTQQIRMEPVVNSAIDAASLPLMLVPWMITAARPILPSARLVAGPSSSGATGRNTAAPCSARASGITVSPAITITERKKKRRRIHKII